jgi:hypothetical protein
MATIDGSFLMALDGADTYPLRKTLFDEYGPSDRRIKKLEKAVHFRVDGCEAYTGADGNPLSHVCTIFARVADDGSLKVSLSGNVPLEAPVQRWIESVGAACGASSKTRLGLSFSLKKGEQDKLSSLAHAMRDIVGRGRRYSVPSFKYTCPRTSDALERLRGVLDKGWK